MNRPRITTAAVTACMAIAGILAGAPPASAGAPILANAHIYLTYTATSPSFNVCASGNVDDGTGTNGLWLFTVDGARTDGTPIDASNLSSGESYSQCVPVQKNGTADGGFVATLWFATVGSGSPNIVPDFTAVAVALGTWNPNGGASLAT